MNKEHIGRLILEATTGAHGDVAKLLATVMASTLPRRARKVGGSYQATGTVVSEFKTKAGATRYVFEFDEPRGMLHIFGPEQVEFDE